jgi:hypothetical protein
VTQHGVHPTPLIFIDIKKSIDQIKSPSNKLKKYGIKITPEIGRRDLPMPMPIVPHANHDHIMTPEA